jgi:hypothetical protein
MSNPGAVVSALLPRLIYPDNIPRFPPQGSTFIRTIVHSGTISPTMRTCCDATPRSAVLPEQPPENSGGEAGGLLPKVRWCTCERYGAVTNRSSRGDRARTRPTPARIHADVGNGPKPLPGVANLGGGLVVYPPADWSPWACLGPSRLFYFVLAAQSSP